MAVQGTCDQKFQEVRQEFERNFAERGEVGASVCVTVGGQTVVDLWGGTANPETETPWTDETVSIVFSSTKAQRPSAPMSWRRAANSTSMRRSPPTGPSLPRPAKRHIPVKMLLNHQAGLPAVRENLPQGAYADWDLMVNALAKEEPFWEPGTRNGYHALTYGWLVGEVVRRVSGKSLGTFFRDEIAQPLGLDFWIGLPEDKEARVAPMIAAEPDPSQRALPGDDQAGHAGGTGHTQPGRLYGRRPRV